MQEALACRVPNPVAAARQRMRLLCPPLEEAFLQGGPQGSPEGPLLLLYVSKFLAADTQNLRLTGDTLQGRLSLLVPTIIVVIAAGLRLHNDAGEAPRSRCLYTRKRLLLCSQEEKTSKASWDSVASLRGSSREASTCSSVQPSRARGPPLWSPPGAPKKGPPTSKFTW